MELTTCLYCQGALKNKRSGAKFCSLSCKNKYAYQQGSAGDFKIEIKEKEPNHLEHTLKGVLGVDAIEVTDNYYSDEKEKSFISNSPVTKNSLPEPYIKKEEQEETAEYKRLNKQLSDCLSEKGKIKNTIDTLNHKLEQEKGRNGNWLLFTGTGAGMLIGNQITDSKNSDKNKEGNLMNALFGGAIGLFLGGATKALTAESREKEKRENINAINVKIQELTDYLNKIERVIMLVKKAITQTNRYHVKEIKVINPAYFLALAVGKKQQEQLPLKEILPIPNNKGLGNMPAIIPKQEKVAAKEQRFQSDKIITAKELKDIAHKALNFTGKWSEFFGLPSTTFHCVIHGMSGEGKSTFAIHFAKYLAQNFGRVLFVSGEEGTNKTFRDKVINNKADVDNLFFIDLRTGDQVMQEIGDDEFHFIFIDSLNNMDIDAGQMKEIRRKYKNSAIITICQSTKDGKIRGSYEIVHDCDMSVKVTDGVAVTTKNRFKEKNMTLKIFNTPSKKPFSNQKPERNSRSLDDDLRNTICNFKYVFCQ